MWHARGTRALLVVSATGILAASVPVAPVVARTWVTWLLFLTVHMWFVIDTWHVWRDPAANGATRRIWRAFFGTGILYTASDLVQLVTMTVQPWSVDLATGVPGQQLLVYTGTGLALLAALVEPLRLGSPQARLRFWLDVGVVLVGVAALGVFVVPVSSSRTTSDTIAQFVVGPAAFSAIAFVVLKLAMSAERPFSATAGRILGLAAAGEAALALITMRVDLAQNLTVIFAMTLTSNALLALAARLQRGAPSIPTTQLPTGPHITALPYLSMATINALLVWALLADGRSGRTWMVLGAAIVGNVLVMTRQLLSLNESSWLLGELDRRLTELREALRQRDELTARLADLAYHDALTGLANRALFDQSLENAVEARRARTDLEPDDLLTVLLVDLDGFKEVNDTYGHAVGDALLVAVSTRIQACVRRGDVVARFGGDEFCLLLESSPQDANDVADRIVEALGQPFDLGGLQVHVGASVGLASLDPCTRNGYDLVRRADAAMYSAKGLGKGRVFVDQGR
ncbi:GGDEF domain-containing protein [Cellulomonas citrea]|uniref:GGDEF domain-containing protein n=1 Tax=Cellulomonas citrea TaxID=1909423 RepID=UPI001359618A|nr:GGDEF domain-containing protein [Cellulomonas citrea]